MNQAVFEEYCAFGDLGESIGGVILEPDCPRPKRSTECADWRGTHFHSPDMNYNGILVLAARYLVRGVDDKLILQANIDWSSWPLEWRRQGKVPVGWAWLPAAMLRSYFQWDGCDIVKGNKK